MNSQAAKEILKISAKKAKKTAVRAGGKVPFCGYNVKGEYLLYEEAGWTDSFFPGMLYIAASSGEGEEFINLARRYDGLFDSKLNEKLANQDHDLGFLYSIKDVYDYRLTGSGFHKERALRAAEELLKRYNDKAKIIHAWNAPHPLAPESDYREKIICDTMMNMPLMMWAYKETKEEKYKTAAVNHSKTAARTLIREDGSAFHTFDIDHETGEPKKGQTIQGYSDDSCWARGLSWLIYGFAMMYARTGDEEFSKAAKKTARYFYENLPAEKVPLWDFAVADNMFRPYDASAGAIAVCGMLEIERYEKDEEEKEYFKAAAEAIINALTNLCSTHTIPEIEPVLIHTAGSPVYKKGSDFTLPYPSADTAIIYGDYFYMEALLRYAYPHAILPW